MTDSVSFQLDGTRDLVAALKELRGDLSPRYMRAAVRKAAKVMETLIKAGAPSDTGKLRSLIKVRTKRTRQTVRARVVVPTIGKGDDPQNAFYWRFVEKGHRVGNKRSGRLVRLDRASSRGAASLGVVDPQPFVEPVVRTWTRYGVQIAFDALEKAIDRAARRQARRGGY